MASLVHHPVHPNPLSDALCDISRRKYSMSIEELYAVQQSLLTALSLVCEVVNSRRCSISRLPPEILAHIFSFVPARLPHVGSSHASSRAKQTYDLIPVTHVCQRWRAIALGTSSLWSTVCETSAAHSATRHLRSRARRASLTVFLDRPRQSTAMVELLACDGADVVELNLHGLQDMSSHDLVSELLAFPASRLERAVVRRRGRCIISDAPGEEAKPVIELWAGMAPRLKTLDLHDLPFLPSNVFAGLTNLTLSYEHIQTEWTPSDLLDFLSKAPSLKHVRLRGLPSDLHLRHPSSLTPVSLPSLRTLEIGNCRGQCSPMPLIQLLLSHINVPTTASIRVYGADARNATRPLSPLQNSGGQSRLDLDMSFSALTMTVSRPSAATISLELSTAGASKVSLEDAVKAFTDECSPVRELTISSQRAWSVWCDPALLLSALPELETLRIDDGLLVPELLDALREPVCHRLRTVRLPPLQDPILVQRLSSVLEGRSSGTHRPFNFLAL
ncbi:hypothetical protein GY45DRAFT_687622 [Cubamyces sp. BRFM 1775]|nr:hypothetical protein GY45DRAFT_687622 [Cubamyces sp. BRFM 1775]